jgi:hypothetical protein
MIGERDCCQLPNGLAGDSDSARHDHAVRFFVVEAFARSGPGLSRVVPQA